METGYYWIKKDGKILPARWDGNKFHHEHGHCEEDECEVVSSIMFSCPTGCRCTQNPDGSWNVNCTKE